MRCAAVAAQILYDSHKLLIDIRHGAANARTDTLIVIVFQLDLVACGDLF